MSSLQNEVEKLNDCKNITEKEVELRKAEIDKKSLKKKEKN